MAFTSRGIGVDYDGGCGSNSSARSLAVSRSDPISIFVKDSARHGGSGQLPPVGNEHTTRHYSYVSELAAVPPKWGGRAAECEGLRWCSALVGGDGGALVECVLLLLGWQWPPS
ncbi:hypothetical protein N7537_010450 [Penicillium hordei]|uniref:Uncharacterized protein n=1 Tax=Penicillium hordei TaxID=40994 RepID=A0AAD6DUP9_9EURO|nr:uncharacterized protein N7537_010450 [Penicillium hordei]KAJ5593546.1 hypothetical protein N7537_010450 [Penicillium hordei]